MSHSVLLVGSATLGIRGVLPHTVPVIIRPMLFELDGVTIERDAKVVLQDVTASLPTGASCVAGPSGCGKSTLLRLLNRLADPDAGVVRYRGRRRARA